MRRRSKNLRNILTLTKQRLLEHREKPAAVKTKVGTAPANIPGGGQPRWETNQVLLTPGGTSACKTKPLPCPSRTYVKEPVPLAKVKQYMHLESPPVISVGSSGCIEPLTSTPDTYPFSPHRRNSLIRGNTIPPHDVMTPDACKMMDYPFSDRRRQSPSKGEIYAVPSLKNKRPTPPPLAYPFKGRDAELDRRELPGSAIRNRRAVDSPLSSAALDYPFSPREDIENNADISHSSAGTLFHADKHAETMTKRGFGHKIFRQDGLPPIQFPFNDITRSPVVTPKKKAIEYTECAASLGYPFSPNGSSPVHGSAGTLFQSGNRVMHQNPTSLFFAESSTKAQQASELESLKERNPKWKSMQTL